MTDWQALRRRIRGVLSNLECEELARWNAIDWIGRDEGLTLEVGHWHGLSTCVLLESLPLGNELVTVDHHRGDRWVTASSKPEFEANVEPFRAGRKLSIVYEDFKEAVPKLTREIAFCFYDADHSEIACESFWKLVGPRMALGVSLLCFDDADWPTMNRLRALALADGYEVVNRRPFFRGVADKEDPRTYTLEVMARGF